MKAATVFYTNWNFIIIEAPSTRVRKYRLIYSADVTLFSWIHGLLQRHWRNKVETGWMWWLCRYALETHRISAILFVCQVFLGSQSKFLIDCLNNRHFMFAVCNPRHLHPQTWWIISWHYVISTHNYVGINAADSWREFSPHWSLRPNYFSFIMKWACCNMFLNSCTESGWCYGKNDITLIGNAK